MKEVNARRRRRETSRRKPLRLPRSSRIAAVAVHAAVLAPEAGATTREVAATQLHATALPVSKAMRHPPRGGVSNFLLIYQF